jgi:CBS domain-containing protein
VVGSSHHRHQEECDVKISETLRRSSVAVEPSRGIAGVASVMTNAGVGAVAVVDDGRLVGIVTDRDLVRRGLARGLSPEARVDGVMSSPVVTIDADADLHAAYAVFGENAVRRLAVVDGERFVGMVTVDDLLIDLASDLAQLARPVTAEVIFGHHDASVPAVP